MARKPSIILTTADKKSAAKDLRGELKAAKARLKLADAVVRTANKAAAIVGKEVVALEERLAAMVMAGVTGPGKRRSMVP